MTDLTKAIFSLWTLAETKVWPEGAPTLVIDHWYYVDGEWVSAIDGCDHEPDGNDIDAALWRCVQLVAWDRGFGEGVHHPKDAIIEVLVNNKRIWDATPQDWIEAAVEVVQSFQTR